MKNKSVYLTGIGLVSRTNTKTFGDQRVIRYEFDSFNALEKFILRNFETFTNENFSTKAVGKVLLVFKYQRKAER